MSRSVLNLIDKKQDCEIQTLKLNDCNPHLSRLVIDYKWVYVIACTHLSLCATWELFGNVCVCVCVVWLASALGESD